MRNILSVLVTVPIDKLFISNIVTAYLIKYSPIYISQSNFLERLREPTTSRSDGIKSGRIGYLNGIESFLSI